MPGGVARPSHNDRCAAAKLAFKRSRGVVKAGAFKLFPAFRFKPAIIGAGCNDEAFGMQARSAALDLQASTIFLAMDAG